MRHLLESTNFEELLSHILLMHWVAIVLFVKHHAIVSMANMDDAGNLVLLGFWVAERGRHIAHVLHVIGLCVAVVTRY